MARGDQPTGTEEGRYAMDFRLELVPVPVSDVDRAKAFYSDQVGFGVDLDFSHGEAFRVVQLTPPGSACSIAIGTGVVGTAPGSIQGLHLVVDDIQAARKELIGRGVDVGEVQDMSAPDKPTVSYAAFTDPDGNGWTLQQLPH
jgi:catechol 2,3-dioxygenase-like lactoylglutathione lyase family enzyme